MPLRTIPRFIRISDLAEELEVHPTRVEKCIYRGVIEPDGEIKHGRSSQPIFLESKLREYVKAIRAYQTLEKEPA